jgi:hypothetical protein
MDGKKEPVIKGAELWLYLIGGGTIAAYVALVAAKSLFRPLL